MNICASLIFRKRETCQPVCKEPVCKGFITFEDLIMSTCHTKPFKIIYSSFEHLLRKMLLTSSWLMGGFLELAAILRGLRKQLTRM